MASTAACNLLDKHRHLIANFNFNVTVSVAAVKYSFAQAGEILPKINVFKQYYYASRNLFTSAREQRCSCDVVYSSAQ